MTMFPANLCETAGKIMERNSQCLERHPDYKESQEKFYRAVELAREKLVFKEYCVVEDAWNYELGVYFETGYLMGLLDGIAAAG